MNPHRKAPANVNLRAVASFEIPLPAKTVASSQVPNPMVTARGRQIHKPREW